MPRAPRRSTTTGRGNALDAAVEGVAPRTMIAAAQRMRATTDVRRISQSADGWAKEAWRFYDTIGEFRYAVDWVAQMIAKATILINRDGQPVAETDPAIGQVQWIGDLFGSEQVRTEMLRNIGVHLTVAGECYLVGTTVRGGDHWQVAAACELTQRGKKFYLAGQPIESATEPFLLRIWRPHPRKPHEANAPSRAVLPILAEMDALTKRIFAEIDSRLAGAGILFVPSEFTLPTPTQTNESGDQERPGSTADQFQAAITSAIIESIGDQSSASARSPIVVTVPGDRIDQITHLTFATPMDERVKELRDEAIRRLALGMDLPPEIMTGMADTNHWTAWNVDESAIKVHAEPLLDLITDSLTTGLLWPLLEAAGIEDVEQYAVGSDTAEMRLRPDRSREAFELYDRGVINPVALRREVGFDELDAPGDDEVRAFFLRKVAAGQTTPELVAAALQELGINLSPAPATPGNAVEARPIPSLREHPNEGPPNDGQVPDGLISAADVIVHRALERAGNRLRTRTGSKLTCPAGELYLHQPVSASMADDVLTDAFGALHRYVACRQADQDVLEAALDAYCRALLTTGRAHSPALMAPYLGRALSMAKERAA
jgi:hypothetical protein